MSSLLKHSVDGRLYVCRPRPGEDPNAWIGRHARFCRLRSVTLESEDLLERFILIDDLPPDYRDVLDEK